MNTITSDAERLAFEAYWLKRQRSRGFGGYLSDAEMLAHPDHREDEFCTWQAARSSPGAGLRLVPEVPNDSVLLFLMGGLVEPQEADELQEEITQEEADAINDRCRKDARLYYAEILNIATKVAA